MSTYLNYLAHKHTILPVVRDFDNYWSIYNSINIINKAKRQEYQGLGQEFFVKQILTTDEIWKTWCGKRYYHCTHPLVKFHTSCGLPWCLWCHFKKTRDIILNVQPHLKQLKNGYCVIHKSTETLHISELSRIRGLISSNSRSMANRFKHTKHSGGCQIIKLAYGHKRIAYEYKDDPLNYIHVILCSYSIFDKSITPPTKSKVPFYILKDKKKFLDSVCSSFCFPYIKNKTVDDLVELKESVKNLKFFRNYTFNE